MNDTTASRGLAPATYAFSWLKGTIAPGFPERDTHFFNLTSDIPANPEADLTENIEGSTLSDTTLRKYGYELPPVPHSNPVSIRKVAGGYQVKTPHGIKSFRTTHQKALAQKRILDALEHRKIKELDIVSQAPYHANEGKIPLDSIIAVAPPIYRLNYLISGGRKLKPVTPVQIFPGPGYEEVGFKFWGFSTYDVHRAFGIKLGGNDITAVDAINYRIVIVAEEQTPSIMADYEHKFKRAVVLGYNGIYARHAIFRFYPALEHLPKLPYDWQYLQFIG
jgi:hypothetical protein